MNLSQRLTGTSPRLTTSPETGRRGFTLIELLVSITILTFLLTVVGVMIGILSRAIGDSRQLLNPDDQARLIFTRMASDFTRMVNRKDVDIIFAKQSGSTTVGANDAIYFVTEASGSNASASYISSLIKNPNLLSLVGYCIAADAQGTQINPNVNSPLVDLNRLGHALTWDTVSAGNTTPDNLVFVSFAAPTAGSSTSGLITSSTLDGHWGTGNLGATLATLGAAPTYAPPTTSSNYGDYHGIGDQVFRFEYCFLLKDGTYSNFPVMDVSTKVRYNTAATGPPTPANDSTDTGTGTAGSVTGGSVGYSAGSRWYDKTDGRAFICSDATAKMATWGPLGVQDVSAIIVAIAMLDRDSRNKITSATTMTNLPGFFADSLQTTTTAGTTLTPQPLATSKILMQQNWQSTIDSPTFATTANLPKPSAGHIRVYQRYFYLNANNL